MDGRPGGRLRRRQVTQTALHLRRPHAQLFRAAPALSVTALALHRSTPYALGAASHSSDSSSSPILTATSTGPSLRRRGNTSTPARWCESSLSLTQVSGD